MKIKCKISEVSLKSKSLSLIMSQKRITKSDIKIRGDKKLNNVLVSTRRSASSSDILSQFKKHLQTQPESSV